MAFFFGGITELMKMLIFGNFFDSITFMQPLILGLFAGIAGHLYRNKKYKNNLSFILTNVFILFIWSFVVLMCIFSDNIFDSSTSIEEQKEFRLTSIVTCSLLFSLLIIWNILSFSFAKENKLVSIMILSILIYRIINSWIITPINQYVYYDMPFLIGLPSRFISATIYVPLILVIDYLILFRTHDYLYQKIHNQKSFNY